MNAYETKCNHVYNDDVMCLFSILTNIIVKMLSSVSKISRVRVFLCLNGQQCVRLMLDENICKCRGIQKFFSSVSGAFFLLLFADLAKKNIKKDRQRENEKDLNRICTDYIRVRVIIFGFCISTLVSCINHFCGFHFKVLGRPANTPTTKTNEDKVRSKATHWKRKSKWGIFDGDFMRAESREYVVAIQTWNPS